MQRSFLLVLLAVATGLLQAQLTEATISGVITDAQHAAVPDVLVTATHTETGVSTTVRSNATGFYSLRPLPIGSYSLTAETAGFRKVHQEDIVLTTGQTLELNFALEVGAVTENVTVTSEVPLLETRNSDASQLVESKTIEDMPLGDRRASNIFEITGTAVFVPNDDSTARPSVSLAGGRSGSQMFWIDGGSGQNMRIGIPMLDIDPPIESLQEVKIMANGFSAEFGGSAGGVIIASTKSGTNRYTGSLFEYLRNQALDAPNFFSPIVDGQKSKPSLRYNVFGGTIGGPVRRDKTFFFFSYEGSRRRDGSVRTLTVPSVLERQGNFTQSYNSRGVSPIYDPATGQRSGTTVVRDPFPGNVIPASRMDAIGAKLVEFYPVPNRFADDLTGANNFRANDVNRVRRDNVTAKLDHSLSNRDKVSFRYMYNIDGSQPASVFPVPAADINNQVDNNQSFYYGAWTRIVTASAINEMRLTYGRRSTHNFSSGFGEQWPSKLGFNGVSDDAFPQIKAAGYTNLGSATHERRQFPIQQYQLVDSLSWVRGRHTLKFGGEARKSANYEVMRASVSGSYTFSRGFSGAVGNTYSGNGFATLLMGAATALEMRSTEVLDRHTYYLSGFVQDDWAVHSGLTLNLGMRWETDTPLADANGRINSFDPRAPNPVSGTLGAVKFMGINGFRNTPYDPDWNNFGPRAGFAWRPFGLRQTVVRGGFGIFFSHPFEQAVANAISLGFERSAQLNIQDNNLTVPWTLQGGLPIPDLTAPVLDDSYGAVAAGQTPNQAVTYLEPYRRTGYSLQSNLRVQHELPGRVVVEAGYVGNLSRKLSSSNINTNQIPPALMALGSGVKDRPYPQFTSVTLVNPAFGVSGYHAGALKAEKRFSRGFNVLATYTWAKFLDNTNSGGHLGDEGNAYSDYYNRRPDWGPSENDIRQRVTWSSVYQFPFGKGKSLLQTGWAGKLLGGWSLGSVMVLQSGAPITVATQTNTTYSNSAGALRADVTRDPNLPADQRTVLHWFDTGAFQQPAAYRFGNQGMGLIRGPGLINVNGSLIRTFRLAEKKQLQFRGEIFNAINHTNLGTPARVFEGPGFGVISSARPARQVQLGLRLTY